MTGPIIPQNISAARPLVMFNQACQHARFHRLWAHLTRSCFCLQDLAETLASFPAVASHYAGIKTVSIDRIRGTQGKAGEFDDEFNPIQERSRTRWMGIALEKLRGRDLPPVELVQIEDVYYVRDGHHRISVARALGQSYVDAEVTIMLLRQQNMLR